MWDAERIAAGEADVLVAEFHGEMVGYVTVRWTSSYPPFVAEGIPEIADFNVLAPTAEACPAVARSCSPGSAFPSTTRPCCGS